MVFEQNATNNVADVDCNAPGGSILNGVRFDTGAVNNTVWLTTQGTITNPVVDNSGGCNTVYLNGAEYSTCSVKITLNGNDAAVAPAANATAAYLQLTNTHNTGGSGAQIQFGHTVGNPYATFGSALTDGSNNGTGDLVWGIRAGSSGSVTERMRLTQAGTNLILAGLVGTNSGGITAPGVSLFGGSFSGTVLQNTVFTVQSSNDHGASAFGSTTYSEDNTAGATGATIRAYNTAFNNHPSSLKTTWNEYKETHVTKQAVVVQTFGNEDTIYNRGVVATLDPYTPNITGSTENYRVDCGEGTFTGTVTASSAGTTLTISAISAGGPYNGQVVTGAGIAADTELVRQLTGDPQIGTGTWETSVANTVSSETMTLATDPKGCTVGFHLMNNGANYRHGIVIGSDALDTAAGRIAPALAMGQNHSVSWYSAANTEAWRIYSTATAHMGDIKLADAGTITFAAATTTDMLIQLNPASTGQNAYFQFLSANVGKFILGKDAADKFFINDLANGNVSAFAVTSAGNTTVGESSKTLTIPSTPILTGVATGTPVASLCLDATNNVVKKTTTGACI
jgi:hypothetical protein